MSLVLSNVLKETIISDKNVVYFNTDEIVFDITDIIENNKINTLIPQIETAVNNANGQNIKVRAEYFELYKITNISGYMKKFEYVSENKGVCFKCVSADDMPLAIRAYKNEPVVDNDLVFVNVNNHRLAKWLEIPDVKIVNKIE